MTIRPKARQSVEVVELIAFPILESVLLNVSAALLSTGKQGSSISFAMRVFFLYCSDFRMRTYAWHLFTPNVVVPVSSVGACGPKPFGLTPRPQASLRLRPSQYRRRLDQAARSSAGLPVTHFDQRCDLDPAQTEHTGKQNSDTQRCDP
jgi:hypothetical protein